MPLSRTFSALHCARVASRFVRPRLRNLPSRPTSTPCTFEHDDGVVVRGLAGQRLQVGDGHVDRGLDVPRGMSFVPLAPTSMLLRGTDGPEVEFVPTSVSDAVEVADAWVERLLDEGWQPQDVALLTTGARHPVQKERQEASGFAAYWEDFDVIERACGRDVREGLLRWSARHASRPAKKLVKKVK
jgi:hypothetical protein